MAKLATLRAASAVTKQDNGAPGIDGVTFAAIEAAGVEGFLAELRDELVARTYRPLRNRRVEIPKGNGKVRIVGIPAIRDRVVLCLCEAVGRAEGPAPFDAGEESSGLRLVEVEYGVAL